MERVRRIGDFTVRQDWANQPEGWAFVEILDVNGARFFSGVMRNEDVPLEVVAQLENARLYYEALRTRPITGAG